jgi:hypothetical protein
MASLTRREVFCSSILLRLLIYYKGEDKKRSYDKRKTLLITLKRSSVVIATGEDFFAGRLKKDGVLILGGVTPGDIDQRRVSVDDARINQLLEGDQVLLKA